MTVLAPKYALTVDKYHRMIESGIFTEDDRVELLEGDVVERPPISSRHAGCVNRLSRIFVLGVDDRAIVRIQNPITLGDLSEPEPDVVVAKDTTGGYWDAHPTAQDVLLLIEVSDSSHRYDDSVKLPLYARHGVREVWQVDLVSETLTVHREPVGETYRSVTTVRRGDTVAPEALPDLQVPVAAIFGS